MKKNESEEGEWTVWKAPKEGLSIHLPPAHLLLRFFLFLFLSRKKKTHQLPAAEQCRVEHTTEESIMKKRGCQKPSNLRLSLPPPEDPLFSKFLTPSGTFKDGNLLVNKDGLRIVPQDKDEEVPTNFLPPIPASISFATHFFNLEMPSALLHIVFVLPSVIKPSDNQLTLADVDTIKVIGKGSGGVVQLVRHKWTGQFFALKVIPMTIQESVRRQIAQELKINQSSQCPYVVVYYHSFYDNGVISIVLEYMDGGSLADFLKKVISIPEPYLADICKQVLKGLLYLHHEKHIIHRDLKPSNILINHRGEVKITDFGVSAILESTSGQRETFIGTFYYMSPERITGGAYGYKGDIWGLGIILLECATGHFPYSPPEKEAGWTSFYELLEAIVEEPTPSAASEQFSPEFCSFISAW
ncbi:hypothetical protein ACLOJK_040609 [Asimina triloba]